MHRDSRMTKVPDHYVLVSMPIADRREPVRSMYREEPENPHDTGWRLYCGDEDDQALEDPERMVMLDLAEVVQIEPGLGPWLERPVGTCLEREDQQHAFVESADIALFDTENTETPDEPVPPNHKPRES